MHVTCVCTGVTIMFRFLKQTASKAGVLNSLTEKLTVAMQRASATMQLLLLLHVRAVMDVSRRLRAILSALTNAQLSSCKQIELSPAAAAWYTADHRQVTNSTRSS
jgi:hypothetical protein